MTAKKCLLSLVTTKEEAEEVFKLAKKVYSEYNNMSLFNMIDYDVVFEQFINEMPKGVNGTYLLAFKDSDTKEYVGCAVVSIGSAWFNPKLTIVSEEVTIAFKKGYGISRNVGAYMQYLVSVGKADMAVSGNAQKKSSKQVENSYKKLGYDSHEVFYYVAEELQERLDKETE